MENLKKKFAGKQAFINLAIIVLTYVLLTVLMSAGLLNRQYTSLLVPIAINVILAVSLNLITGFLGELSLGHAGFMSIGAYVGALITINMDAPEIVELTLALLAGGAVAAFFGFIIGMPVLRLNGDYLAIVTLGFGEIIKSVLISMKITNGAKGLQRIPLYTTYKSYTLVFILMVISVIAIMNIVKSRHGRAICSIRDNSIATQSIGINVSRFKVMTFVISAFFAGIAGVLYAHNVGILKPTTFDYNKSIEILVIVVLGGMGSIRGSVIAAIILTALPELLRGADDFRMLLYAVVLIIIMLFNHSKIKEGLLNNNVFGKLFKSNEEKVGE